MIHVGTSGFVYKHWKGIFYPADLPAKQWLARYAAEFQTVELNNTFYRLPTADAVDGWRRGSPARFVFAVKGSRYLTHVKRLKDATTGVDRFFDVVRRLGPKLGPVLWQLPPKMRPDLDRLETFLRALPRGVKRAFEFRDAAWYSEEVCDVLDRHRAAFCEHDLVRGPDGAALRPPRLTGGFRYVRFHGWTGKYEGRYGTEGLLPWARDLASAGLESWVYFNNDIGGHALVDARALLELLGRSVKFPAAAAPDPRCSP
ncbi:MAG TPA: DUF72 domain-containing protein [Anaeromyxobacteraceae bacterium]|nr:DUF72 domain-containing protein [Anaeromyxobacteraceae bacterium]